MHRLLTLVLILNMAAPSTLSAQSSDVPPLTLRTSSRLVMVDVIVTDKKGQPVTGLKADDFTVEENGKKQKISMFVPPLSQRRAPTSAPPGILSNHPENVGPAGVPIVLVLDATNSPFKEQAYGRAQMLKYVAEQSQAGRPMAVLALTDRLHVLQQFSSDPQVLATAIKNFRPQEPILQANLAPAPSAVPPEMAGVGRGGLAQVSALRAEQAALADFTGAQVAYNLERRTLVTVAAMQSLSRMLGGLQGRKNVVWLTAELPFDLIPENRNVSDSQLLADLPVSQSKSLQTRSSGALAAEERSLHGNEIRAAEAQLANANVAIYPVDLHGLVSGIEAGYSGAHDNSDIYGQGLANQAISQGETLRITQGTMEEVAAETGGKAYINQNEIRNGIALAAADDKASYEIGYYPENKKWDGKYRSIKMKIAQGDIQIRYRKGYFAADTGQTKNQNFEPDVANALQVNAPFTQIYFMAQAKPADAGKVRVLFLVDAHTLSTEDSGGNKKINVSFYATVFGENGKGLASRSTKVDRSFDAATYQQILEKGMMVPIDLEAPPGSNELRLAVLDNKTGFIGTVSGPLGQ
ncbi:MAG: VWA domain-containing protein [Acidobacteria bacterium]|nr:VWA domain-containing protein [Acidobacteriota bacterium]